MSDIFKTVEYQLIKNHYNGQTAKRTGVPLINHIHEGLMILDFLFPNEYTYVREAYCLHPLFQSDEDLGKAVKKHAKNISLHRFSGQKLDGLSLILAMEYRNIANQYLSHRTIHHINEIALSPLFQVNQMLIADKVQNRKDFELYHEKTHPRSAELKQYFSNWLTRLGVTEQQYQYWKNALMEQKAWIFLPNLSNGNGGNPEMVMYVYRDPTTEGRFKLELINEMTYDLLHTFVLEYEKGGYLVDWQDINCSGYWKEEKNIYVFGSSVNGESHRSNIDHWEMDFSKWIKII